MIIHIICSALRSVILSVIILTLSSSLVARVEAAVPAEERDALVALYNSTSGDGWRNNTNWLSGDPCTNSWFGITCNGTDTNITQIDLGQSYLRGKIPSALKHLNQIENLYLHFNSLTGSIPPELGDLSQLKILWLNSNSLTGPIPAELGKLHQLVNFHLENNELCGALPATLVNLTSLAGGSSININNNSLLTTVSSALDVFLTQKSSNFTVWKTTQNSRTCFSWNLFLPAIINNTKP